MDKIQAFEIERMLFGEAPRWFLLEVFCRGLLLYLYMIFIMRLLGKRMAAKLTVAEMVLTITLGGSIAVAIQVPEGGMLVGFVVLTCALAFERGLSLLELKQKKIQQITTGESVALIKDGVVQVDQLNKLSLTHQQIYAKLRTKQVHQLGQVERLYLEAGGDFSLYKKEGDPPYGLSVYPDDDTELLALQKSADHLAACTNCGNTIESRTSTVCEQCGHGEFMKAIQ